jgi:Zn-dependent peptidase ImmA (M78 family)
MKKYPKIEGILHDISVSLVSQKYLDRIQANKGETVEGCYVYEDALIYVSKELSPPNKIHSLFHELYHMIEHHTERMDSEARADAFATWMIRLFKPESIEELLKK